MAESSRTSEQNLLIQARLDKQAARKQVIGRIRPLFWPGVSVHFLYHRYKRTFYQ